MELSKKLKLLKYKHFKFMMTGKNSIYIIKPKLNKKNTHL